MDIEEQREAVARAICLACGDHPNHVGDCRGNDFRWQDYWPVADAAIRAMAQSVPLPGQAPPNCRNRRRKEGKSYPKSICQVCGPLIGPGGKVCPYERTNAQENNQ